MVRNDLLPRRKHNIEIMISHAGKSNAVGSDLKEHVLCQKCQHIVEVSNILWRGRGSRAKSPHGTREHEVFRHYSSFSELKKSALAGCHLCSIICDPLQSDKADDKNYCFKITETKSEFGAMIQLEGEGIRIQSESSSLRKNKHPGGTLRLTRTNSDEVFHIAQEWLSSCLSNHKNCKMSRTSNHYFPRRVLKVVANDHGLSVRLCTAGEVTDRSSYITLSHCWGGLNILKLTKEKLLPFSKAIPLQELPKTFLDAALIAVRLGFQYLWIDSLCILQDSADDRDEDIRSMGHIYRNSVCTIAALGAENSHDGCFVRRSPLAFSDCMLRNSKGRTLFVSGSGHGLQYSIGSPDESGKTTPPLHKRAWVVQERTLSPRTLYYGSQMIFWECIQSKASELNPSELNSQMAAALTEETLRRPYKYNLTSVFTRTRPGMKSNFANLLDVCQHHDYPRWRIYWHRLVHVYTANDLTFKSDRWAAISGLARLVEQASNKELLHGLWKDDLVEELLWCVKCRSRVRTPTKEPSWSWLSVDGPIIYKLFGDGCFTATILSDERGSSWPSRLNQSNQMIITAPLSRFQSRHQTPEEYYMVGPCLRDTDAKWNPDYFQHADLFNAWALLLKTKLKPAGYTHCAGLAVMPTDESHTRWVRIGYFAFDWRDEDSWEIGPDPEARPIPPYFEETKTIVLI